MLDLVAALIVWFDFGLGLISFIFFGCLDCGFL